MKALGKWTCIFSVIIVCTVLAFVFGQSPLAYDVPTLEQLAPCAELDEGETPESVFSSLSDQHERLGIKVISGDFVSDCFGASADQCRGLANVGFVGARNFAINETELTAKQATFIEEFNGKLSSALIALTAGNPKRALLYLTAAAEVDFQHHKDRPYKTAFAARPLTAAFAIMNNEPCHPSDPVCINLAVTFGKFLFRHNFLEEARAVFRFATQSEARENYPQHAVLDIFFREDQRFSDSSPDAAKIALRSGHLYSANNANIPAGVRFFFAGYSIHGNENTLLAEENECLMNTMHYSFQKADQHFIRAGLGADWEETFVILSLRSLSRWLGRQTNEMAVR